MRRVRLFLIPLATVVIASFLSGCTLLSMFGLFGSGLTAPGGLAVVSTTGTTVTLNWGPNGAATSFTILQATSKNGSYTKASTFSSSSAVQQTVQGLTPDTPYWFEVKATDSNGGTSPASTPIQATTAPTTLGLLDTSGTSYSWGVANTIAVNSGDVLADGWVGNTSTESIPALWANSFLTTLPLGSNTYGKAYGMTIDPNTGTLYIAGYVGSSSSNRVAALWSVTLSNGIPTPSLQTLPSSNSEATAIVFAGANLWVVGDAADSSGVAQAQVWEYNTSLSLLLSKALTSGSFGGSAESVSAHVDTTTSTVTIYAVGSASSKPTLWSIPAAAPTPAQYALGVGSQTQGSADGLYVDQSTGDVTIAGSIYSSSSSPSAATWVWTTSATNPAPTVLPTNSAAGAATGVTLTGSTYYVAGYTEPSSSPKQPTYWYLDSTNSWHSIGLPQGTMNVVGHASGAFSSGADYYIAGSVGPQSTTGSSTTQQIPVYWKNGK